MDDDAVPLTRSATPKSDTIVAPSDAELSRIARQAVHQPADPRLDRQLARMIGVMDTSDSADVAPSQPIAQLSVVSGADLERLQARLRRIELVVGALVVAVGVVAALAVASLLIP